MSNRDEPSSSFSSFPFLALFLSLREEERRKKKESWGEGRQSRPIHPRILFLSPCDNDDDDDTSCQRIAQLLPSSFMTIFPLLLLSPLLRLRLLLELNLVSNSLAPLPVSTHIIETLIHMHTHGRICLCACSLSPLPSQTLFFWYFERDDDEIKMNPLYLWTTETIETLAHRASCQSIATPPIARCLTFEGKKKKKKPSVYVCALVFLWVHLSALITIINSIP